MTKFQRNVFTRWDTEAVRHFNDTEFECLHFDWEGNKDVRMVVTYEDRPVYDYNEDGDLVVDGTEREIIIKIDEDVPLIVVGKDGHDFDVTDAIELRRMRRRNRK